MLPLPAGARRQGAGAESLVPLAVIAHAGVSADRLEADEVRRIFLMRRRFWEDGARVRPVNLPATAAVRVQFSRDVLGSTPRQLTEYFNDLYFHGTPPPPVLESERAVLLYVARTPGAIGYVSVAAIRPEEAARVKVLFTFE